MLKPRESSASVLFRLITGRTEVISAASYVRSLISNIQGSGVEAVDLNCDNAGGD